MSEQDREEKVTSRRNFMKLASVGTLASGVALATQSAKAGESNEADDVNQSGYRETDHVKTYYKLAGF